MSYEQDPRMLLKLRNKEKSTKTEEFVQKIKKLGTRLKLY